MSHRTLLISEIGPICPECLRLMKNSFFIEGIMLKVQNLSPRRSQIILMRNPLCCCFETVQFLISRFLSILISVNGHMRCERQEKEQLIKNSPFCFSGDRLLKKAERTHICIPVDQSLSTCYMKLQPPTLASIYERNQQLQSRGMPGMCIIINCGCWY